MKKALAIVMCGLVVLVGVLSLNSGTPVEVREPRVSSGAAQDVRVLAEEMLPGGKFYTTKNPILER